MPDVPAKFMSPWSFSEGTPAEKYMAQLQHNIWVANAKAAVLSEIGVAANGLRPRFRPIRSTSSSCSRWRKMWTLP
jgi:hypothetical protein